MTLEEFKNMNVKEQLLYDMKQQYNYILLDEELKWNDPQKDSDYLKNWIKYKLYIKKYRNFDSDSSDMSKMIITDTFKNIDVVPPVLNNCKYRTFTLNLDQVYQLDTDTMSSMATKFEHFMKSIPDLKNINILTKNGRLNYIEFLNNFDLVLEHINNSKLKDILELYYVYARVQNTIGNFILIPKGENVPRYQNTQDDLIETIKYFEGNVEYKTIFEKLDKELSVFSFNYLEQYKANETDEIGYPKNVDDISMEEYKNYLKNVINLILIRGLHILKICYDDIEYKDDCDKLINEIRKSGYECILKNL